MQEDVGVEGDIVRARGFGDLRTPRVVEGGFSATSDRLLERKALGISA